MRSQIVRVFTVAILLAGSAGVSSAASQKKNSDIDNIGNRDINKRSLNLMSLEKEMALGRQLAAEVERTSRIVKDPDINEYVNRIGQNIVRNSDAKVPFTIKIIDSDEVNAFALPGGFFFVNSGLILAADTEAELAGVMAHEIAHVTARHATEQQSKGQLLNLASIPLIFVGLPPGVPQAINVAIPLTFLKFSRGMEEEADYLGVQYLYKTGYDPSAMVSFFEKLQAKEKSKPGSISKLFSSHPATADRIRKVGQTITSILPPADSYVETTSDFERMKANLAGVGNRRPLDLDAERPTLRRKSPVPQADDPESAPAEDDDRPTLKRRVPLVSRAWAGLPPERHIAV